MNDKKQLYTYRYSIPAQNAKIDLTGFLSDLHQMQLDMIDEALDRSDLRDAKELIDYIKSK